MATLSVGSRQQLQKYQLQYGVYSWTVQVFGRSS